MVAAWIDHAQNWLQKNADRLWKAWLETKQGKAWKSNQNRQHVRLHTDRIAPNSPYAYGFSLPDYHHDLIKASGKGDEETAKAIMLYHGIGACSVGD